MTVQVLVRTHAGWGARMNDRALGREWWRYLGVLGPEECLALRATLDDELASPVDTHAHGHSQADQKAPGIE